MALSLPILNIRIRYTKDLLMVQSKSSFEVKVFFYIIDVTRLPSMWPNSCGDEVDNNAQMSLKCLLTLALNSPKQYSSGVIGMRIFHSSICTFVIKISMFFFLFCLVKALFYWAGRLCYYTSRHIIRATFHLILKS